MTTFRSGFRTFWQTHGGFKRMTFYVFVGDFKEVWQFELVSDDHDVNADIYVQLLQRVFDDLKANYPVLFNRNCAFLQHDNTLAHTANMTQHKHEELETLLQHTHNPDFALLDDHIFRSMDNVLRGWILRNMDEVKNEYRVFLHLKKLKSIKI